MLKLKNEHKVFNWLTIGTDPKEKFSKMINGNKIQEIYHFSSWQIHGQIVDIRNSIETWQKFQPTEQ